MLFSDTPVRVTAERLSRPVLMATVAAEASMTLPETEAMLSLLVTTDAERAVKPLFPSSVKSLSLTLLKVWATTYSVSCIAPENSIRLTVSPEIASSLSITDAERALISFLLSITEAERAVKPLFSSIVSTLSLRLLRAWAITKSLATTAPERTSRSIVSAEISSLNPLRLSMIVMALTTSPERAYILSSMSLRAPATTASLS